MDIVERLRIMAPYYPDLGKAADEIERLRDALQCLLTYWDEWKSAPDDHLTELSIAALSLEEVVNMARSALKEKE